MRIDIDITGVSGSERISLLADIYHSVSETMPGYFTLPEAKDFDLLTKRSHDTSDIDITMMFRGKVPIHFGSIPDADIFIDGVDEYIRALDSSDDARLLVMVSEEIPRETIGLMRTKYRGKSAVVMCSVKDIMRYVMAFVRGRLDGELYTSAERISGGIGANTEAVLCGHELFEGVQSAPVPAKSSSSAMKIIAGIVLGFVAGGAAGYLLKPAKTETVYVREEVPVVRVEESPELEGLRIERDVITQTAETLSADNARLQEDIRKLQAEVKRLRDKDKNSIRIRNPFK